MVSNRGNGSRGAAPGPKLPGDARPVDYGALPGYLGFNLRRAQAAMFVDFARLTAGLELTPGQFSLLTLLAANPGISQVGLSRAFGLDKSTVSPSVDRLEKRGLVRRSRTPSDRRYYALELTEAGHSLLTQARERVEAQERVMAAPLTSAERSSLIDMLQRIEAALSHDGPGAEQSAD